MSDMMTAPDLDAIEAAIRTSLNEYHERWDGGPKPIRSNEMTLRIMAIVAPALVALARRGEEGEQLAFAQAEGARLRAVVEEARQIVVGLLSLEGAARDAGMDPADVLPKLVEALKEWVPELDAARREGREGRSDGGP